MSLWETEFGGGVVIATYNNPPMNYFCAEGAQELGALIEGWRDNPDVRVVVLTGGIAGRFITHYSVEELEALAADREEMRAMGTALNDGYHALLQSLERLPKPVLAAMNGDTMGGGFELSLACDIRIAQNGDHRYGLPEVKLGILPGGGGTQRLSRLVGAGRAIEFILRGRVVPAEPALGLGLVHECAEDALARARELAAEMVALPTTAVAGIKHAVYAGSDTHLGAGLSLEASAFLQAMLSDDGVAAMRAYLAQPLEFRRDWLERPDPSDYEGR